MKFQVLLSVIASAFVVCGQAYGAQPIKFKTLPERCPDLQRELKGKHLYVKYSDRNRSDWQQHANQYWMLYWQDNYVPIPKADYRLMVIVNYRDSVTGLLKNPGFILSARDGTSVVFMHYFKTLQYVHTNGIEFARETPGYLQNKLVQEDLVFPEASLYLQRKIFKYTPADINCTEHSKTRLSYRLSLLLVKDVYSSGVLLSAFPNVGKYTGWVSLERLPRQATSDKLYVWKAFYKRLMLPKVVSNIRIYTPYKNRYGLLIGIRASWAAPDKNRPQWLQALERYGRNRSLRHWNRLRRSTQRMHMKLIDRKPVSTATPRL